MSVMIQPILARGKGTAANARFSRPERHEVRGACRVALLERVGIAPEDPGREMPFPSLSTSPKNRVNRRRAFSYFLPE